MGSSAARGPRRGTAAWNPSDSVAMYRNSATDRNGMSHPTTMHLACGDAASPALIPASGPRRPRPTASPSACPSAILAPSQVHIPSHLAGNTNASEITEVSRGHDPTITMVSTRRPKASTVCWTRGIPPSSRRALFPPNLLPAPPARITPATPSTISTANQAFPIRVARRADPCLMPSASNVPSFATLGRIPSCPRG